VAKLLLSIDNPAISPKLTEEQLTLLGIAPGVEEVRFDSDFRAVVATACYPEERGKSPTNIKFWSKAKFKPNGQCVNVAAFGHVKFQGKRRSAFTSSQMFTRPDGRLVEIAIIHLQNG
jgi:hypothetical protein